MVPRHSENYLIETRWFLATPSKGDTSKDPLFPAQKLRASAEKTPFVPKQAHNAVCRIESKTLQAL